MTGFGTCHYLPSDLPVLVHPPPLSGTAPQSLGLPSSLPKMSANPVLIAPACQNGLVECRGVVHGRIRFLGCADVTRPLAFTARRQCRALTVLSERYSVSAAIALAYFRRRRAAVLSSSSASRSSDELSAMSASFTRRAALFVLISE